MRFILNVKQCTHRTSRITANCASGKLTGEIGGDGSEADCSHIMPVHFLFLSRSTHAKSGWAKPVLPYIQTKQQITACPSNPTMHQGMCHCHHAAAVQSPCSRRHQSCCCTPGAANPHPVKKKKKKKIPLLPCIHF